MMGVFEDSLNDARWLVANMVNEPCKIDLYFIIVTVPFRGIYRNKSEPKS